MAKPEKKQVRTEQVKKPMRVLSPQYDEMFQGWDLNRDKIITLDVFKQPIAGYVAANNNTYLIEPKMQRLLVTTKGMIDHIQNNGNEFRDEDVGYGVVYKIMYQEGINSSEINLSATKTQTDGEGKLCPVETVVESYGVLRPSLRINTILGNDSEIFAILFNLSKFEFKYVAVNSFEASFADFILKTQYKEEELMALNFKDGNPYTYRLVVNDSTLDSVKATLIDKGFNRYGCAIRVGRGMPDRLIQTSAGLCTSRIVAILMNNRQAEKQMYNGFTPPLVQPSMQNGFYPSVSPYSSYGGVQNPFIQNPVTRREYTKDEFQSLVDRYRHAVNALVDSDELDMEIALGSCENPHNENLGNFWTATHPTLPEFTAKEWTAFDAKKKVKDVLREIGLARALMHNTTYGIFDPAQSENEDEEYED